MQRMRRKIIRMQTIKHNRITNNEYEEISRSLAIGMSIIEIVKELGRNWVTIFQEINRKIGKSGYRAFSASRGAEGIRLDHGAEEKLE